MLAESDSQLTNTYGEVLSVLGVGCRVHDLGHDLSNETIQWPQSMPYSHCYDYYNDPITGEFGLVSGNISCPEHFSTHVDAPFHFSENQRKVDQLTPRELVAPCRVICIQDKVGTNPEISLSAEDILAHETEYGAIPEGCVVLIYTGWSRLYDHGSNAYMGIERGAFDNPSDPSIPPPLRFPGILIDAAELLVQRRVAGVGLDTPSLDPGSSGYDFPSHKCILSSGIYGIENINSNLAFVPPKGSTIMVMPMKIKGGTGAPTRIFALCP